MRIGMLPKILFPEKKIADKIYWKIQNDPFIYFVFNIYSAITPRTVFHKNLMKQIGQNGKNSAGTNRHKYLIKIISCAAQKFFGDIL